MRLPDEIPGNDADNELTLALLACAEQLFNRAALNLPADQREALPRILAAGAGLELRLTLRPRPYLECLLEYPVGADARQLFALALHSIAR